MSELDFAIKLLHRQNLSKSTVFSPVSISLALALVHLAANGNTRKEIADVILNGSNDEEIQQHFSKIMHILSTKSEHIEVLTANHIFTSSNFPIKQDYLQKALELYLSSASSLDFSDSQFSADKINQFVDSHTKSCIKEVISADDISEVLVAVLVNVIYFKGEWLNKFNSSLTYSGNFFNGENAQKEIKFLHESNGSRKYIETDTWQVAQFPYLDESFVFHVLLPKARFGLESAIESLTSDSLQQLLANQKTELLNIHLPKISIEADLNLNEALKSLGIVEAFSDIADLSNIAENLYVSKVSHKAKIDVDEEGTTAAAATTVLLKTRCRPIIKNEPILFNANHPFLFILSKDNLPLFMGIYS